MATGEWRAGQVQDWVWTLITSTLNDIAREKLVASDPSKTCFPISSMHPFVRRHDKRICRAENSESVKIWVRLRG